MSKLPDFEDYGWDRVDEYHRDTEAMIREHFPIIKLGGWNYGAGNSFKAISFEPSNGVVVTYKGVRWECVYVLPYDQDEFFAMVFTMATDPAAPQWFKDRIAATFGGQDPASP